MRDVNNIFIIPTIFVIKRPLVDGAGLLPVFDSYHMPSEASIGTPDCSMSRIGSYLVNELGGHRCE